MRGRNEFCLGGRFLCPKWSGLAWVAWFCRKKACFESPVPCSITVATGFLRLIEDYKEYARKVFAGPIPTTHQLPCSWSPPDLGVVKINTDAHVVNGEMASLGAVLRDYKGVVLAAGVKRLRTVDAQIAEAEGLRYGLELARRLGYFRVHVESDSLMVVQGSKQSSQKAMGLLQFQSSLKILNF